MTEETLRDLLRDMREEPVPADSRARVRVAVEARTRSWPERMRRHWTATAAILIPASIVLVFALIHGSRRAPVVHPAPAAEQVRIEPPVLKQQSAAQPAPQHVRPSVKRASRSIRGRAERASATGTVIRIETPDPDVVILFVGG